MIAPLDIFKSPDSAQKSNGTSIGDKDNSSKDLLDDGTDAPKQYKSAREERIYLGRGYNRLGVGRGAGAIAGANNKPKRVLYKAR